MQQNFVVDRKELRYGRSARRNTLSSKLAEALQSLAKAKNELEEKAAQLQEKIKENEHLKKLCMSKKGLVT
eukprot:177674-Pleurochrysis_carterae.AAC.2